MNCYFPTDPQTLQFNDKELLAVLEDIENILDNNIFDDCIIGGDFNFDKIRTSGFVHTVSNFLSRIGLSSVWEKFPVDFTHLDVDLKSSSTIKPFLCQSKAA